MFVQRIRRLISPNVATVAEPLPASLFEPVLPQTFPRFSRAQTETQASGCIRLYFPSYLRTRHHES